MRKPQTPGRVLLRMKDVAAKTGLSPRTIYLYMRRGDFPKQHRIVGEPGSLGGIVAWDLAEVDAWIVARVYRKLGHPAPEGDNEHAA